MSSETTPISPTRFATALKDLPASSLHLKVAELRNSIAHLDYSNEQLRPFTQTTPPDADCVDAIAENEQVIARMQERIRLVRAEVEGRGMSWVEFRGVEETKEEGEGEEEEGNGGVVDAVGVNGGGGGGDERHQHPSWSDGTFQTGVIRNGEVHMDRDTTSVAGAGTGTRTTSTTGGGSISDEELRRRMEEQLRSLGDDDDDEEGGLHL
ncbi:hypothetical protein QBC47DRAFT_156738 [Echria macrotheca]|uniref:Uncharacterized protein n=1 Tax=Echria macrotheca TaxID=438768 RepID=A0AAJ0FDR5_9PEZI|nr:hypothetical protein QBC47DRAFT_156738 [Echria macrotheca]